MVGNGFSNGFSSFFVGVDEGCVLVEDVVPVLVVGTPTPAGVPQPGGGFVTPADAVVVIPLTVDDIPVVEVLVEVLVLVVAAPSLGFPHPGGGLLTPAAAVGFPHPGGGFETPAPAPEDDDVDGVEGIIDFVVLFAKATLADMVCFCGVGFGFVFAFAVTVTATLLLFLDGAFFGAAKAVS